MALESPTPVSTTPVVGVVLVVYHQSDEVISATLSRLAGLEGGPYRIYVTNNEVGRDLTALTAGATLLEAGTNGGFCGGVNLAARAATADGVTHLLLLNFDTFDLATSTVADLLAVASSRSDCFAVSPVILHYPATTTVWYRGGVVWRPVWMTRHPGLGQPWRGGSGRVTRTDYFSGCCALLDLATFNQVGGFDERLFMYYDEIDLATRVRRATGRECYLLDEARVAHEKDGRSFSPNEAYYHARNARLMVHRYERGALRYVGYAGQLALALPQLARCGTWAARRAYLRGLTTSLRALRG